MNKKESKSNNLTAVVYAAFSPSSSVISSGQDMVYRVLLFLFLAFLPLSARLPHGTGGVLLLLIFLPAACGRFFPPLPKKRRGRLAFFAAALYATILLPGLLCRDTFWPTLIALGSFSAFFLPYVLRAQAEDIALFLSVCGGFLGLWAGAEYFSGFAPRAWVDATGGHVGGRACAAFSNPNVLCAFLLPCFFLCLWLLTQDETPQKRRILLIPSLVLSLLGIGVTFCRGGWLALVFSLLLFLYLRYGRFPLALAALTLPGLFFCLPNRIIHRFFSLLHPDTSAGYRLSLWRSISEMPWAYFLCGAGEGRAAFWRALLPGAAAGLEAVEHTHSLFLHVLCAGGVFALAVFFVLLFLCFTGPKKSGRSGWIAALCALVLFGLFDDPFYTVQIGVIFWLLVNVNLSLQFSSFSS